MDAQRIIDVMRQVVSQMTQNGAQRDHMIGYTTTAGAYQVSAYLAGAEFVSPYIEIPAGMYVPASAYIEVVRSDEEQEVRRVLPTLFSRLAFDFINGRAYVGSGSSEPSDAGSSGQVLSSGGPSGSAYWGTPSVAHENVTYSRGYMPFAYPIGYNPLAATTTTSNLVAVSASKAGVILIPFELNGPMSIQSYIVRCADSANLRTAEAALYYDNGTSTLQRVAGTTAAWSFTPGAAGDRPATIDTPGTLVPPGMYWIVLRNTSTSQTFGVRRQDAPPELAGSMAAQDNVPNGLALGSTYDTSLLTLTGVSQAAFRINGRVLGSSSAF